MGSRSGEASNGHARSWLVLAGAGTGGTSLGSGLIGAPRHQTGLQNHENTVGPDLLVGPTVSLYALWLSQRFLRPSRPAKLRVFSLSLMRLSQTHYIIMGHGTC